MEWFGKFACLRTVFQLNAITWSQIYSLIFRNFLPFHRILYIIHSHLGTQVVDKNNSSLTYRTSLIQSAIWRVSKPAKENKLEGRLPVWTLTS